MLMYITSAAGRLQVSNKPKTFAWGPWCKNDFVDFFPNQVRSAEWLPCKGPFLSGIIPSE